MKASGYFLCAALLFSLFAPLHAAEPGGAAARERGADTLTSVVGIRMKALADARTSPYLGTEREGSGIVIDDKGHIVTIGYVVIEADSIQVTEADGTTVPATLVGYDHGTGFGVLRPSVPLKAKPLPLGSSAEVAERDPVLVVGFGGRDAVRLAFVVSLREFAGNWEYLLDSAIFTTPPADNWAGSALIDREGRLVGVGSLLVRDSAQTESPVPGNMFVPIDLLKPILSSLIEKGRAPGPARPWLGLATEEVQGHLIVSRVSPDGPAENAGVRRGDIVVAVGAEAVASQPELYRKVWRIGPAGVDVPLRVLQGTSLRELKLQSIDRVDYLRTKPAY